MPSRRRIATRRRTDEPMIPIPSFRSDNLVSAESSPRRAAELIDVFRLAPLHPWTSLLAPPDPTLLTSDNPHRAGRD
jgi:hypothetical protein